MWPHRQQPTRLPRPWDSPGKKNPGVGCHFLLQCMKVKSESEVTQSCPTFCDPMDCTPPGSSVHGIFQARVLEWGAIAFSNIVISAIISPLSSASAAPYIFYKYFMQMALFLCFEWKEGWVLFHCIFVPYLLYPFLCPWTCRLLHILPVVNSAAINIEVHVFFGLWFSPG